MRLVWALAVLAAQCCLCVGSRDTAFINYSEAEGRSAAAIGACRDGNEFCSDWAAQDECNKNAGYMLRECPRACNQCNPLQQDAEGFIKSLVMVTKLGEVHIKLLWDVAPRTCALIMDLALKGTEQQTQCKFYRNEAAPQGNNAGPPYGLLQGTLAGLQRAPPPEGRGAAPTYGRLAMITGSEFYISLMDHSSWGSAHTVWGEITEGMEVVERIVSDEEYTEFTHPVGTKMRMMKAVLPFRLRPS